MTVALWSLLLFVPGIVAMVKLALTEAMVALERTRRTRSQRSRELTDGSSLARVLRHRAADADRFRRQYSWF